MVDYSNTPPVMQMKVGANNTTTYLVSLIEGQPIPSIFFLTSTQSESPPLLILTFLQQLSKTYTNYFGPLSPEVIKENFSTCYLLLEEMVSYGLPLTTHPNALESIVPKPSILGTVKKAITGEGQVNEERDTATLTNIPWRRANVRYAQNEVYVDLVEEIDCILSSSGSVISSDINGSIQCQSHLSGVPDLTLTFQDPTVIDDCSFHPCVRYNRYERDSVISFVPPDGNFELMRYRATNMSQLITPPITCNPSITFGDAATKNQGRVNLHLSMKPTSSLVFPAGKGPMTLEDVVVTLSLPTCVTSASLTATHGSTLYDESTRTLTWTLSKLTQSHRTTLSGPITSASNAPRPVVKPIEIRWKCPMASVSGLAVSGLSVMNEGYKPYKGVRTVTKSGTFCVRVE